MLQETFSFPSQRKLPSLATLTTSPTSFAPPSNSSSSISSFPAVSADAESPHLLPSRRHSSTSTLTTSDTSEDELETPPTSPRTPTLSLPRSKATLGNPVDWLHYPFSIAEICEDDDHRGPSFNWFSSPDPSTLPRLPSVSSSLDVSPAPFTPSSPSLPLPSSSQPEANRPTRQEEEASRGRNRAPRLLWRSEIDEPSMEVLNRYYLQMSGGPLPRLKMGMGSREIRDWSRRVEEAGI